MKTNELMIGDWVNAGYNSKVTGIDLNTDAIRIAGNIGWFKTYEHKPVPITPEILEANGFEKYGHRCSIWLNREDFDNHTEIEYRIDQNWFELKRMANRLYIYQLKGEVHYVHELQHLLRAAGLNEMADSFVIEKGGSQ